MESMWQPTTAVPKWHVELRLALLNHGSVSKEFDQSKYPIARVQLQRLEKCLDQKVTVVRRQSTGSSA